MIKANLRLVVKIAREYEGIGLPLLDLVSEGNIGLMKAVERFDPAKGAKLSTYSSWWIKQAMKRALANQSKTIRLPVHLVDKLSKMRRTANPPPGGVGPGTDRRRARRGIRHHGQARGTDADRGLATDFPRRDHQQQRGLDQPCGADRGENADTPYEQLADKAILRILGELVKTLDRREEDHSLRAIRAGRAVPKDP